MKNNKDWNIKNSYINLPSKFYSKQLPEKVLNPQIKYFNSKLAVELGLEFLSKSEILDYFSGNRIPKGAISISQAYAGHQFGNFTVLGDGRAILIGEQITPKKKRYDIQLKGSGKTPYSRLGDGKATLTSVLREYLISEAMYHLKIPSSRSLSVIKTGENVYRNETHDGGILTRICSSHIRFGTFEFASRFCSNEDLKIFIKYVIDRHYPQISDADNPTLELLKLVMIKQIDLIINWMRVGFIHGVMNTDNMSIVGETIDYGPCAFMNVYDPDTVFSSIDVNGRYSFGNQPMIAHWNLVVLANTLLPIISNKKEKSIEMVTEVLNQFSILYSNKWYKMMLKKLGIMNPSEKDKELVDSLLDLMNDEKADYTNTFAALALNTESDDYLFKTNKFKHWKKQWKSKVHFSNNSAKILKLMQAQNPILIPRNYLVEIALKNTENGSYDDFNDLMKLVSNPYDYKSKHKFQVNPEGYDDTYKTFCGT